MSLELVVSIAAGVISIAITVIGVLLVRAVNSFDARLEKLEAKIDTGHERDTQTEIWKAEFSLRLLTVETKIAELFVYIRGKTG